MAQDIQHVRIAIQTTGQNMQILSARLISVETDRGNVIESAVKAALDTNLESISSKLTQLHVKGLRAWCLIKNILPNDLAKNVQSQFSDVAKSYSLIQSSATAARDSTDTLQVAAWNVQTLFGSVWGDRAQHKLTAGFLKYLIDSLLLRGFSFEEVGEGRARLADSRAELAPDQIGRFAQLHFPRPIEALGEHLAQRQWMSLQFPVCELEAPAHTLELVVPSQLLGFVNDSAMYSADIFKAVLVSIGASGPWAPYQVSVDAAAAADRGSRARTLQLSLERLGLLSGRGAQGPLRPRRRPGELTVHVAGAQWREEGGCAAEVAEVFGELLARLASGADGVGHVPEPSVLRAYRRLGACYRMLFCPGSDHNLLALARSVRIALVGPSAVRGAGAGAAAEEVAVGSCGLEVLHRGDLYHEAALAGPWAEPDVTIAFQPGIWGYDSWEPSVRRALLGFAAPLVVTSYNEAEADDDQGSLEDFGWGPGCWAPPGWPPEPNPEAALAERPSSVQGRLLREQHWWQCLAAAGPEEAAAPPLGQPPAGAGPPA
ncbi:unnamed protein product [Prorocentrum cordatum]|uniref:Mitochondrial splicing suppressor 51-like C-terminal domain-containing protein n=1 Tax=Prorocentrum cordatum TaxID=2364126 RepID=A0ABN9U6F3_9DINO|nr:unnamed protein product [Polarella glacialis]